ncbi:peptidylprolyl isomerase [Heliobacterium undosum]|uniref:Peptidyl-prolyl cis-trans isomerase n=1 Tax=Heliomicrobium undosum TaxID=121734 RepID=A0A845L3M7_9FIRM|nr:peptidylprolyl isomerase [Heliomicrobium undosum]MZP30883.1 peptidylprolyl isomerase [Heliomicrobium undosum]
MQKMWKTGVAAVAMMALFTAAGCSSPEDQKKTQEPPQQTSPAKPDSPKSSTAERNNKYQAPPSMQIDPKKQYTATVQTNRGAFKIELLAAEAPKTVNNFVFLAREGYFDGIRFHRIIKDFMIQTGDPMGNGTGGPGYKFADELPPKLSYGPGVVAMANAGPNTNGSQFFICNGEKAKNLNQMPNYTVFGRVIDGMETVLKISDTPVTAGFGGEKSKPAEEIIMERVTIEEK